MVDVTGIEPATPCLQRLDARRINKLAVLSSESQNVAKWHELLTLSCLKALPLLAAASHRVGTKLGTVAPTRNDAGSVTILLGNTAHCSEAKRKAN